MSLLREDQKCQAVIDVAVSLGALHKRDWIAIRQYVERCMERDAAAARATPMALYSPGEGELTREDAR